MTLPQPSDKYDPLVQATSKVILERADAGNQKRNEDHEIKTPVRLILFSPDGSRWQVKVDNAGTLSAVSL